MAKTARFRVCLYAYTDLQQHHVATEYLHTPFLQQFPHSVSGVSCLCYWCVPFHGNQVQATIATTHIPEHVTIQSQLQFTLLLFSLVSFAVFPCPFCCFPFSLSRINCQPATAEIVNRKIPSPVFFSLSH